MPLPAADNTYFLQSVGWAIIHSFWQTALLYLLYWLTVKTDRKLPAQAKYYFSTGLMLAAFSWFCYTVFANYSSLARELPGGQNFFTITISATQYVNVIIPYLSALYFLLLSIFGIRFFKNLAVNRSLQQNGLTKASLDVRLFTKHTALHLGIKKQVQVWISTNVDVPSVTGFIKPMILLPAAIVSHLTTSQVEAILLHELAHIRRNDYIIHLFQAFIELILFFNPFIFLLSKEAKKEREHCCDDWVLNFQYKQFDYAQALLVLEEQRQLKLSFVLAATNNKKLLLDRIKRLFDEQSRNNLTKLQQYKLTGISVIMAILIICLLPFIKTETETFADANTSIEASTVATVSYQETGNKDPLLGEPKTAEPTEPNAEAVLKPTKAKRKLHRATEQTYVSAYINQELITGVEERPMLSLAAETTQDDTTYLVKIEEQQSGTKEVNTYVFELKGIKGTTPTVKPLLLLNKLSSTVKASAGVNISMDSIANIKATIPRKRTTS